MEGGHVWGKYLWAPPAPYYCIWNRNRLSLLLILTPALGIQSFLPWFSSDLSLSTKLQKISIREPTKQWRKNTITLWKTVWLFFKKLDVRPSNSGPEHIPKRNENRYSNKNMCIAGSYIIHDRQELAIALMPMDTRMDRQNVVSPCSRRCEKLWSPDACHSMDGTWNITLSKNKPDTEGHRLCLWIYIWNWRPNA